MRGVFAIARRELEGYFSTPLGWIVLTAFLAVTGFFFAFALYEFQQVSIEAAATPYGGAPTVNDWLLPGIFGNWAIILLLIAPAVTMRLFSEDLRQRSFELLLSSPLSSGQIVAGKFLGVAGFLTVLFATTLYQVAALYGLGSPDPGIIATSYAGMFAMALTFAAVGLLASSLTDNQLVAFMVSFAALLLLFVMGWFEGEDGVQGALGALSMLSHVEALLKGLLHLEDAVYFVSFVALLLFATQQRIESFRWASGFGGSSRTVADAAIDIAAGIGLLVLISKGVRLAVQGSDGVTDGAGNRVWLALVVLGVVAMGAWAWRNRASLAQGLEARGTRLLAGSLALVSLATGVTVAANILAARYDQRWDLTVSQRYALSPQTSSALAALSEPVELFAFFQRGSIDAVELRTLLDGYTEQGSMLTVRFVDPVEDPLLAREHEVTHGYGTLVFVKGDATQRLTDGFDEEAITNALLRLSADRRHTVCLTTGHQELDLDDTTTTVGLGLVTGKLSALNYDLQPVALAREGGVPSACAVVIVAGPQSELLAVEREQLAAFVVGGGQLLVLLDPVHAPETASDLARYGVAVGDDLVLEQNPSYQVAGGDISYVFLDPQSLAPHPITAPVDGGLLLRIARSVAALDGAPGVQAVELAHTTTYGWAEADYTVIQEIAPTPGRDRLGPVPLMVAAEVTDPAALWVGATALGAGTPGLPGVTPAAPDAPPPTFDGPRAPGGRVVVIGDTDFASNELVDQLQNADLFLNTVAWLVGEDAQVSIRKSEASRGSLDMSALQFLVVALVSLLFVPGGALVAAVSTWRRRSGR